MMDDKGFLRLIGPKFGLIGPNQFKGCILAVSWSTGFGFGMVKSTI